VIVDLDNDVAEAIYDGQSIYSWPWSEGGSNGTGPLIIDAIDFYGATADDEMYVDNFLVELAGLDWLTLNGGLGVSGLVAPSDPADIIAIGVNAGTYPVGIYNKVINMTTNELCGAKNTYAITVTMNVGYSISGNVYYGIAVPGTKPMETGTTVTLTPGSAVSTGTGGAYDFRPLAGGGANYTLSVATTKAYNFAAGVANNDALFINRYVLGNLQLTTVQKRAGDVNFNNEVAGNDALFIKRRVLGNITAWPAPNLNWVYATTGDDMPFGPPNAINGPKQVTISGANVIVDLRMLETGDVNSSWTPPAE